MQKVLPRIDVALWSIAVGALLWLALGDRVLTHIAYAVESGRLQATSEELDELQDGLAEVQAVSRAFKLVSKIARPGVVHLYVSGSTETPTTAEGDTPEEQSEDYWRNRPSDAIGSGIIFDADGYILTNNHVVTGRRDIRVILNDEREYDATLVGTDPKTDLAVVKIDAPDLHPLRFGDSDALEVGDWVIAVGAPFGLSQTVTHGIVSAKGRQHVGGTGIYYQDFIQTDAAINPGNSGGPLLNLRGEVVGVNTAIASHGEAYNAGVAFTIPSNLAVRVANQLKTKGKVDRGWLGIFHTPVASDDVALFHLPDERGIIVAGVLKDSPAETAGLQVEDVIVSVNGTEFGRSETFQSLVADLVPGDTAVFGVIRGGKKLTVKVTLGLQPENIWAARATQATETRAVPSLGLRVCTLRSPRTGVWRAYGDEQRGVAVWEVFPIDGARPDVHPGELVVQCNGRAVESVTDLLDALESTPVGSKVRLELLKPSGDRRLISIRRAAE